MSEEVKAGWEVTFTDKNTCRVAGHGIKVNGSLYFGRTYFKRKNNEWKVEHSSYEDFKSNDKKATPNAYAKLLELAKKQIECQYSELAVKCATHILINEHITRLESWCAEKEAELREGERYKNTLLKIAVHNKIHTMPDNILDDEIQVTSPIAGIIRGREHYSNGRKIYNFWLKDCTGASYELDTCNVLLHVNLGEPLVVGKRTDIW